MTSTLSDVQLSKKLSWLLRHGALKEGLPLSADGFVPVAAILQHKRYEPYFNLETLQRLVRNDKKQRYELHENANSGVLKIRANQGHSIAAVKADECMQRLHNAAEVPMAVHGTYYRHWPAIKAEGLKCMHRNHIHFAITDAKNVQQGNVSGFRHDCQVLCRCS